MRLVVGPLLHQQKQRGGPRYLSSCGKVPDAGPVSVTFSVEFRGLCQEEKQGRRKKISETR